MGRAWNRLFGLTSNWNADKTWFQVLRLGWLKLPLDTGKFIFTLKIKKYEYN